MESFHANKITIVKIAILITILVLVFFFVFRPQPMLTSTPVARTETIVDDSITISARSYSYYNFTIPLNSVANCEVSGSFSISNISAIGIRVYIMNSTNFLAWKNGDSWSTYYNSGQVTAGKITADLPRTGTYYLVYDNTFSPVPQKNLLTKADLLYFVL
jgi:hypothetical protein